MHIPHGLQPTAHGQIDKHFSCCFVDPSIVVAVAMVNDFDLTWRIEFIYENEMLIIIHNSELKYWWWVWAHENIATAAYILMTEHGQWKYLFWSEIFYKMDFYSIVGAIYLRENITSIESLWIMGNISLCWCLNVRMFGWWFYLCIVDCRNQSIYIRGMYFIMWTLNTLFVCISIAKTMRYEYLLVLNVNWNIWFIA